jgi:hypothetical protein
VRRWSAPYDGAQLCACRRDASAASGRWRSTRGRWHLRLLRRAQLGRRVRLDVELRHDADLGRRLLHEHPTVVERVVFQRDDGAGRDAHGAVAARMRLAFGDKLKQRSHVASLLTRRRRSAYRAARHIGAWRASEAFRFDVRRRIQHLNDGARTLLDLGLCDATFVENLLPFGRQILFGEKNHSSL